MPAPPMPQPTRAPRSAQHMKPFNKRNTPHTRVRPCALAASVGPRRPQLWLRAMNLTVDLTLLAKGPPSMRRQKSPVPHRRRRALPASRAPAFEKQPHYSMESQTCGSFAQGARKPVRRPLATHDEEDDHDHWMRTSDSCGRHHASSYAPSMAGSSMSPSPSANFLASKRGAYSSIAAPSSAPTYSLPPHADILGVVDMKSERVPPQHLKQPRESRARPPHIAPSSLGIRDYSREPEPSAPRSTYKWRPPTPPRQREPPPAPPAVQYDWPAEVHTSERRTNFVRHFGQHEDERQPAAMPPAMPSQAIGQPSFGQAPKGHGPPADVWTRDDPQREMQREQSRQRELEEKYEAARRHESLTRSQQLLRSDPNAFDHSLRGFYMNRHKGTEAAALLTMNPW